MENLRIFDTFQDYIDYKESPDFEMPSANAVHNTQEGYDLMFIDNGINHNIISYTFIEGNTDHAFNYASQIFGENIVVKANYKGIKYFVLDTPLHRFINSTDSSLAGTGIMSISLPDTIKEISSDTFAGCSNLQQVILPKYLAKICSDAFYENNQMQEIIIPEHVRLIQGYAFSYCQGLQTLEFKSKHLENLGIEGFGFCSAPYLKTIICRSKLPFGLLENSSFWDCGTNGTIATDKRFYLPFNFDEDEYLPILGNNTFKFYKVSHKVSNVSGNVTCTIGSTPLNTIASNVGALSYSTTLLKIPVIYGGAAFYDVLGEEYITTTKTGVMQIPISQNTGFETINHTVTFCRNIFNVDTGQDLVIDGSVNVEQWGKPRYRIEYDDNSTGWYDLGIKNIRTASTNVNTNAYRVFRNRNSNLANTSSKLRIYFKNILNPKFYVNNYAESTYDYIQVSALDKTISQGVSTTLSGKQYPNYVSNFTTVEFNVTDGEEHFVEVAFRKDNGVNSNYDAGFINIKNSDISNKTFEVKENHSYADTGNIIHVLSNPNYNGGVHINNVGGSYIHGLPSGVTGVNNIPVYKYNSYDLELDRISGEYSSKNGTNANYLLTYDVINAKSGMDLTPNKNYIPYHKIGTTASMQTTRITTNSFIRVRGFYDNNSMYFDVKQNGFGVTDNLNGTWNSAATDFPDWYLPINDFDTATPVRGIHTVKVKPYSTLTYTITVTSSTGSTTNYKYANYAWEQCATTATKIAPQDVIPNVNFGKLYMSGNATKSNSVSLMTIDIMGYKNFTMYARSSGESNYDYIMISKPNVSIDNFMSDVCLSQLSKTPTLYTYLTLKGKATPSTTTKSLYSASAFTKVEFNLTDHIYTTPTCQIICAFVKNGSQNQQHDAGFIYIPN